MFKTQIGCLYCQGHKISDIFAEFAEAFYVHET